MSLTINYLPYLMHIYVCSFLIWGPPSANSRSTVMVIVLDSTYMIEGIFFLGKMYFFFPFRLIQNGHPWWWNNIVYIGTPNYRQSRSLVSNVKFWWGLENLNWDIWGDRWGKLLGQRIFPKLHYKWNYIPTNSVLVNITCNSMHWSVYVLCVKFESFSIFNWIM